VAVSQALQLGKTQNKPVLVYFYSSQVPACRRVWDEVINTRSFAQMTGGTMLSAVESTGPDAQKCHELGVFRVPSLIYIAPDGFHKSTTKLDNESEIRAFLGSNRS
jgi:hypothetical protein